MKRKHRHTSRSILAFILVLVMMFDMIPFTSLTMEVKATEDDYVITEVPVVDRGQQNNWAATENYDSLVDGDTSTKYGLSNAEPYVEFHYSSAFVPKGYILWTGNDCSERSPESWVIKAMNQGDEEWTILDSVDNTDCGQLPNTISISKTFSIENTSAYQYYRFEAVRNSGSHGFELAEIQFIVDNTDLGACSASGLNQFYKYNGGAAIAVSYEIHAVDGTVLTNSDYTAEFRNAENQELQF